jgi:hypothetical protein
LKVILICILSIIDPDNPPVDVADGTKFIIKKNVDVIKVGTNNERSVYEVHSQQCTGFLNEKEINKIKSNDSRPCCDKCEKAWTSVHRLRKESRDNKSDLQLILSEDSYEFLAQEKDITFLGIAKLSRTAVNCLAYNLASKKQKEITLERYFNILLST